MKTNEMVLDLQAYVDGELDPGRRAEVERVIGSDVEARRMVEGLRQVSCLLRENEPAIQVPETREFYWSQIQRRIAAAEKAESRAVMEAGGAAHWLRWLLPAFAVAAVAVMVVLPRSSAGTRISGGSFADLGDPVSLTFHSDTDCLTIHWIN
jgi:anti-sigma factor RsiW